MTIKLYYWPEIPGRGEFVRLALEEAGAPYEDVARSGDPHEGVPALMRELKAPRAHPPFAPPIFVDGDLVLAQTALILLHLGDRLGLAPKDEAGRLWTHQIQLTITDFIADIHNVHHPLGSQLYYEEQKPEALRAAEHFRAHRLPKFLGWFEPRDQLCRPVAVSCRGRGALRLSARDREGSAPHAACRSIARGRQETPAH